MSEPTKPRSRRSTWSTLLVSLAVCLGCSLVVSVATVVLRPIQLEHRRAARNARLADILGRQPALKELLGDLTTASLEERVVDLATGAFVTDVEPAGFDPLKAAAEPSTSRAVPPERDLARIKRQALHGVVTLVSRGGAPEALIVPIYGRGYGSIIRGSIALSGDGNTVIGLLISDHGETPGIGSEITEEDWTSLWPGKKVRDESGKLRLHVVVEETGAPDDDEAFHVDGISGATRSTEGVGHMVQFWLGDDGYGPFLARAREGALR